MKLADFTYERGVRATPTLAEIEADVWSRELEESNRHLAALHRIRMVARPKPESEQQP